MADHDTNWAPSYQGPHRAAYELWKRGADLREIYSRPTYFRYKQYFMKTYQINIDIPPTAKA